LILVSCLLALITTLINQIIRSLIPPIAIGAIGTGQAFQRQHDGCSKILSL
jgi:hypothetical protein